MNNLKIKNFVFFRRFTAFVCAIFLSFAFLFADAGDDYEIPDENDEEEFELSSNINEPGDQFIKLGLMVTKPLNFDGTLLLGGAGEIGYHRFINPLFMWGVDINFGYNPTIGENVFTYIPFVFDFTFQPTFKKFEFPITAGVGFAMENYMSRTYFPGLILKGDMGIFYRVSSAWSFGIEGNFMYMPQWYSNPEYNDYGLFLSGQLSARYHF